MAVDSFLPHFHAKFAPRLGIRAQGFAAIFEALEAKNIGPYKPYTIIETGAVRTKGNWEGDGQSTILFDSFVQHHSGRVYSVDKDPEAIRLTHTLTSVYTHAILGDSVAYLHSCPFQADLYYLDSFDLDTSNPLPSAFHHIKELLAIGTLKPGTLVAVDDNPAQGMGKGFLINDYFTHLDIKPIFDGYQKLWAV